MNLNSNPNFYELNFDEIMKLPIQGITRPFLFSHGENKKGLVTHHEDFLVFSQDAHNFVVLTRLLI